MKIKNILYLFLLTNIAPVPYIFTMEDGPRQQMADKQQEFIKWLEINPDIHDVLGVLCRVPLIEELKYISPESGKYIETYVFPVELRRIIVEYVIAAKKADKNGEALLKTIKARKGLTNEAKQLLNERYINVNVQDEEGNTSLMLASKLGKNPQWVEIVKMLLQKGANPNLQDRYGRTALDIATARGNSKIIKMLLQKDTHPKLQNKYIDAALSWAKEYSSPKIVKIFQEEASKETKFTKWLRENPDIHDTLGALQRSQVDYPNCSIELRKMIMEYVIADKKATKHGQALLNAIKNCDIDETNKLLEKSYINTDVQNENGETSLIAAIRYIEADQKWMEIVKILLQKGGNPNLKNKHGDTALHLALKYSYPEIVQMLLQKGADLDLQYKDKDGNTPLHWAVSLNYLEIVQMLLQKGVNPNLQAKDGFTTLHIAVINNRPLIVKMLLEKDTNINLQNKRGRTALDIATIFNYTEIVQMLNDAQENKSLNL